VRCRDEARRRERDYADRRPSRSVQARAVTCSTTAVSEAVTVAPLPIGPKQPGARIPARSRGKTSHTPGSVPPRISRIRRHTLRKSRRTARRHSEAQYAEQVSTADRATKGGGADGHVRQSVGANVRTQQRRRPTPAEALLRFRRLIGNHHEGVIHGAVTMRASASVGHIASPSNHLVRAASGVRQLLSLSLKRCAPYSVAEMREQLIVMLSTRISFDELSSRLTHLTVCAILQPAGAGGSCVTRRWRWQTG
jgi:hypothetical protein